MYDVELTISDGLSSDTKIITSYIIINSTPTITVNPTDPIICLGEQVQLTVSGAQNYLWNTGDTSSLLIVVTNNDTTFSVTGNNGNCFSQLETINITVNQNAIALADVDVNNPLTGEIINFNSFGSVGNSFSWDFGDGNSSSVSNPSYQYNNTGVYDVILEVTNGSCTNSDSLEINVGLNGLSESIDNNISIYPNPNNGLFYINFNQLDYSNVRVEIINNLGQTIYQIKTVELTNEVNLKSYSKGIYYVKINIGGNSYYKKINLY